MSTHLFRFASDYLQSFLQQVSAAVDAIATTGATPNLSGGALQQRPHGFLMVQTRSSVMLDKDGNEVLDSTGNPVVIWNDRLVTVVNNGVDKPTYEEIGSFNEPYLGLAPAPVELMLTHSDGDPVTLDWDYLLAPITVTGAWWWEDQMLGNWGTEARLLHRMSVPAGTITGGGQPWDSGWRPPKAGMMTITLVTAAALRAGRPVESQSLTIDLTYFHSLRAPTGPFWDGNAMILSLPSDGGSDIWQVSRSSAGTIQFSPFNNPAGTVELQFWLVAGPMATTTTDSPNDPEYWTGP